MSRKNIDTGMRDRWMAEGIILSFRLAFRQQKIIDETARTAVEGCA